MNFTRAGLGTTLKRIGWPLGLFACALLAIGIGIGLGVVGTSATAVGSDAPKIAAAAPQPQSAGLAAAFLAGRHAELSADANTAVDFYNRVTELDPENYSLLQNTYFLAAQSGDYATAIPAARKALETAPKRGMAPVIVGLDYYKKGEYEKALPYLERTTGQSMNGFAMPLLRAWALAPVQPAETALQELELFKTFQDTGDIYYLMSGLLNEFYDRKDAAITNYEVLAANIENQRFSVLRLVAEGYHRLGKDAEIKSLFDRFITTHGQSPTLEDYAASIPKMPTRKVTPVEGMAEGLFLAAELLLANDPNELRAQVSTAYAQAALYMKPDLDIARRFIGSTLSARGRLEESNQALGQLKKTAPGYLDVQMQIGENLLRMKHPNDALAVLQDILRQRPAWVDAHVATGDILRQEKKYSKAVAAYSNALKHTAADKAENWAIHYSRGIAFDRDKKWDAAEQDFKKALELRPNDPNVLNYLGYSYLDRGVKVPEARKLIEDAYKQRPNDGYIIDSFGWALYMSGEYEQAVISLEKAIEASPSDGTINEHLGDAYWKMGRRNEARFQWQRALSFEIEEPQRAAILKKLESGIAQK